MVDGVWYLGALSLRLPRTADNVNACQEILVNMWMAVVVVVVR